jgi:hypothetical protein
LKRRKGGDHRREGHGRTRATKVPPKRKDDRLDNLMYDSLNDATNAHAKSALKKIEQFLSQHYPGSLTFQSIKKRDIGQDLMGQFATFLFNDPTIQFLAYLSSVKRQVEDSTRSDFSEQNKTWYKRLRYTLRSKYLAKANGEGKSPNQGSIDE